MRASKRFDSDEALLTQLGPRRLRKTLDQFGLWRDQNHVEIKQVLADFATYLYLPRLRDRQPLIDAIRAAVSQLVCDHFAYADGFDDAGQRYVGLTATGGGHVADRPVGPAGEARDRARSDREAGAAATEAGRRRGDGPGSQTPVSPACPGASTPA